jgi:DNA modification methylase
LDSILRPNGLRSAETPPADAKAKPQNHNHPTEKPLGLMAYIIEAIPKKTNRILEPFAGSGTTLEAAKALGWQAVGIERNPVYARHCADKARRMR